MSRDRHGLQRPRQRQARRSLPSSFTRRSRQHQGRCRRAASARLFALMLGRADNGARATCCPSLARQHEPGWHFMLLAQARPSCRRLPAPPYLVCGRGHRRAHVAIARHISQARGAAACCRKSSYMKWRNGVASIMHWPALDDSLSVWRHQP